ncbi:MAG TPA: 50S ribosomal protein L7ae [Clostridiales bacterium]|nr:50S ribosomal protein L7ae [Clostridiales bacterium]
MGDKALSLLGIARRAGKLSVGFEAVSDSIKRKKARLVLIASDISPKTEKELVYISQTSSIKVIRTSYDINTLSNAIGARAGTVSVNDSNFADAVLESIAQARKSEGEFNIC